jgi:hypothetical protein
MVVAVESATSRTLEVAQTTAALEHPSNLGAPVLCTTTQHHQNVWTTIATAQLQVDDKTFKSNGNRSESSS